MKVTVCFNSVRVVVPCGEGDLLVRDLIHKATIRYKKATAKPSQSWVTVHNLKQLDGGILDPDDRLNDVADDREQIIAIYDERHDHHGGDGTSDPSSDSENHSPDIFKGVEHRFAPFSRNDIEITNEDINGAPPPLHVRRGSEPALNRLSPIPNTVSDLPPDPTKRWSAAPTYIVQDQSHPHNHSTPMKSHDGYHHSSYEDDNVFLYERGEGSGEEKTPSSTPLSSLQVTALTPFSRDANRLSVQVLSENGRWADAADRVLYEGRRREPLGGSASTPAHSRDPSHDDSQQIILIALSNDHGPLGIHVIPSTDPRGQDQGLLVEGVEPDGRIARDGRIQVHDRIIEINGRPLHNITFHKAQEIFKDAMQAPELRLRIIKKNNQTNGLVEGEERSEVKLASTRKVPTTRPQNNMQQSNTRKIGRRVTVNLVKGAHGLGFSITTRDNHAGGEAPIYIKSILPKGAAIEDGTLRIGDRLLKVNDVEVTGRSQSEVAGLLRQIQVGGTAILTVSRQETKDSTTPAINQEEVTSENDRSSSPQLPRQLVSTQSPESLPFLRQPQEKSVEDSLMFPWKQREILMFEIPVHDSERAGLGVSVKGKTSSGPNGSVDLGIFVKNVIHGGAASRDGRLLQNDQLVNINGISLLGKPNSESMKTLRNAMNQEGPIVGIISLTVARRIDNRERSSPSATRSGRDSASSLLTNSSGTETLGGAKSCPATPTPDQSNNSDNTLILGARGDKGDGNLSGSDPFDVRNPVIRQLTGNNNALRNESYYKATHDTWNTSQLQQLVMRSEHESLSNTHNLNNLMGSPTVNLPSRDTLIIHDEYETANYPSQGNQNQGTGPAASSGNFSDNPSQSDDAYTSQTSLEESGKGFSRDQLWRQSMSEKRHATLDAKSTDTYQRNKKAREERERQRQIMSAQESVNGGVQGLGCQGLGANMAPTPDEAGRNRELLVGVEDVGGKLVRASSDDSLASHILQRTNHSQETSQHAPITQDIVRRRPEVGPGLGMKKSSSLESLQTMVQEMALEMEDGHRLGSGRVPRGRGCNESFRAAVDRSIEAPLSGHSNKMETLGGLSTEEYFDNLVAEEESESSGSGFGRDNSRQSSVNSGGEDKSKKGSKKKQGIFKGLGSMFRFGKHRKSIDNTGMLQPSSLGGVEHEHGRTEVDKAEMERLAAARRQQQEEHDRMQEQYRRMLENTSRNNQPSSLNMPEDEDDESGPSRSERMHQLRAEHQRRHQQRKGTYPTDEVEERYESQIRQRLEPVPSEPKSEPPRHSRSHSYDVYGEGRPGSRAGYADPHKYSHYVNYEQIQQHLRKNKEQERLKKLASQQYQDFREKQTRKLLEVNNGGLLGKLEETFIHEKIIASREQREYQSQRGPRDNAREHQHRPVSNYYEYESVQAMISHAQSNSTSLPRRHHPPPPIPPPAAAVHSKNNKNMNHAANNNGIGNSFFPSNSQSHHLPMYKQQSSSSVHSNHSGGHQNRGGHMGSNMGHENIYGSSGYRPASAYGSGPHHNKPPQPPSHHHTNSLTVPGSKV